MTKSEFKALEKVLNTIGKIHHDNLTDTQISQVNDSYKGLWDVLTDNGKESVASMAIRLKV